MGYYEKEYLNLDLQPVTAFSPRLEAPTRLYTTLNLIAYPTDQKAMAVAGVCSCNHEKSNLDSLLVFRRVFRWSQEQTVRLSSPRRSCNGKPFYRGVFAALRETIH